MEHERQQALMVERHRRAWRAHAPTVVPASAVPIDSSSTCLGAQHDARKHTSAHEQLETAAFFGCRESGPFQLLTCELTRTHPRSMAPRPLDPFSIHQPQLRRGMGGGESHQSGVPSHFATNLADPAELRDTNHAARRMTSTAVLMAGA